MLVAFVLGEVLDEAAGQIDSLGLPLSGILVGVAGVQDGGINAGQRGGNLEVEVRELLGGGLVCLLYTCDAADALPCVEVGGRCMHQKKNRDQQESRTKHCVEAMAVTSLDIYRIAG